MGNTPSTAQQSAPTPVSEPAATNVMPAPPVPPPSTVSPTVQSSQPQPETPPVLKDDKALADNPGTYDDLHKACKEIFPQPFEGGRVVIGKGLSSHFQLNHTMTLGPPNLSGYRFGATYVGSKQFSPQESYPVLLGDIDASGNLNANIIHAFTRRTFCRVAAQFQGEKSQTQIVTDYKGSSYTASMTLSNPDLLNLSALVAAHYLQRITPSFDLGAECVYQKGGHIPGGQFAMMSLAGKLRGEKWQFATTLAPSGPAGGGCHLSYVHKINDQMQIGSEFETSIGMGESTASVGYQLELPSAGVTFKGQFDTNWNIAATLEKKLLDSQIPLALTLCAIGNQAKSDYKFGIGFSFG
ncbi:Mitochondrial import receptor subunit TOM40B [Mactra antiquata]